VQLASTGLLLDTPELREYVHQIAGLPVGAAEQADEKAERTA
jgi:hypothetical protein